MPVPLSDATSRHPWLFDPYNSVESSFSFYVLTSNSTISIPTSKPNRTLKRRVYSTSLGVLLSYQYDTASYSLINPLIGTETVLLKSCKEVPSHAPRLLRVRDGFVLSIISDSVDLGPDSCKLTFHWRRNHESSCELVSVQCLVKGSCVAYEFYKGMFFINTGFVQKTTVIDATTAAVLYRVPLPAVEVAILSLNGERLFRQSVYLVESSGELLTIFVNTYTRRPLLRRYLFNVHCLEDGDGDPHWVKMRGIGDRAIFLNEFDGFSLRSSEYPRLKKNSIYFMRSETKRLNGDDADDNPFNNYHTVIVASRYDLETGLIEDFPYIMKYWGSWYLPMLQN